MLHAEQQKVLRRVKRTIVHDKQIELPIRHFDDKSIYQRYHNTAQRISTKDSIPDVNHMGFNDPFFSDQWYLVGTGIVYSMPAWGLKKNGLVIKKGSVS